MKRRRYVELRRLRYHGTQRRARKEGRKEKWHRQRDMSYIRAEELYGEGYVAIIGYFASIYFGFILHAIRI